MSFLAQIATAHNLPLTAVESYFFCTSFELPLLNTVCAKVSKGDEDDDSGVWSLMWSRKDDEMLAKGRADERGKSSDEIRARQEFLRRYERAGLKERPYFEEREPSLVRVKKGESEVSG
jgi:hypothetical protein